MPFPPLSSRGVDHHPARPARPARRRAAELVVGLAVGLGLAAGCAPRSTATLPVVEVFGNLTDTDSTDIAASMAAFERRTGIDVRYVGSSAFESDLLARLRRGEPPDMALIPQPALLRELVRLGTVRPIEGELAAAVRDAVDPRLTPLAEVDGELFGSWHQVVVKSLVWYSPPVLQAAGLTVPTSWAELQALTDHAARSGITPWCIGMRDGDTTGWVATDWVEDLLLRRAGAAVYDGWTAGTVPFTDGRVRDAVSAFGAIARDPAQVDGGPGAVLERSVGDAAAGVLASPPRCLLTKQASFLPDLLGRQVTVAPDGDLWFFPLPAQDGGPAPLVVGGLLAVRFDDRPETLALAAALTTPETVTVRAAGGGFLSPLRTAPATAYRRPLEVELARHLRDAPVIRFDASDRMAPAVGLDAFWSGMAAYVGGADLDATLEAIDGAWPTRAVAANAGGGRAG